MFLKKYITEHWVVLFLILLTTFGIYQMWNPSFMLISKEDFKIFQSTYVSILLFVFVFILFQYMQSQNKSYLFYALYLFFNLLYFTKIFPSIISFLISDEHTELLFAWKKQFGYNLELTLSIFLIASYARFIQSFIDLRSRFPKINRWWNIGYAITAVYLVIDYIIILWLGKSIMWELFAKFSLAIPGMYVMYLIFQSRTILFDLVLMGSFIIILGAVMTVTVFHLYRNGFYADDFFLTKNHHFFYMIGGSLLEILFFTTAIGYQSLQNEKEKNEAQQKLFDQLNENNRLRIRQLEADVKTLKSQINPHFIFNSLNAIKLLIQENKNVKANQYLIQFSELMRIVMEQALQPKITLEEELATSKVYLELEALRFEHSFEFEIQQAENIDTSFTDVPPLIFQPFLENAIWHGLLHKEGNRKVRIVISKEEGVIICTIEDNGIGRAKSAALSQQFGWHKKSSIGIKNTKERISIFQQLTKSEITVDIIDLKNSVGAPTGTSVVFKFAI